MPYSGGSYSLYSVGNPVVTATTISSSWANNTLNDIASALSTCVLKDGTQTMTANLPMSGFKLTGLAAGSTAGDSLRYEQLVGVYLPLAGGTMTGNLLFTDATYDIGASGATRPRDLFLSRNLTVGGTTSFGGNIVSNVLFTDATYDIGASGATRPRDLFLSRDITAGGTGTFTGAVIAANVSGGAVATVAQMTAAAALNVVVTPGRLANHPAVAKARYIVTALASATCSVQAAFNVLGAVSCTRTGAGDHTITWTTAVSVQSAMISNESDSTGVARMSSVRNGGMGTTSVRILTSSDAGAGSDPTALYVAIYGDL